MATPFTAYPFATTGMSVSRTLPDRLAQTKNVRDFGAAGDGVTDDLPAIMAAFNWATAANRGTLHFPPGTYYVSAPINLSNTPSMNPSFVSMVGHMGLSTIVGNFSDYVIKRDQPDTNAWGGGHIVEKLAIINGNPSGGGIRMGASIGAAIRDCDITANTGINTNNSGAVDLSGTMEITIKNCSLRPYTALAKNSVGVYACSDGPYTNLTITGFDTGMSLFGGEGAMSIQGCYFEGNNTGIRPAVRNFLVAGCRFKNNGIAIDSGGSGGLFIGILIEAAEGTITGNPQYGIRLLGDQAQHSVFQGIVVKGQYQQAGVYVGGGSQFAPLNTFKGVSSVNSSSLGGVNWQLPTTAHTADFVGCDVAPVFTIAGLPAQTSTITSISWSNGTVTVQYNWAGINMNGATVNLTISGATPSGYNGTYVGTGISYNTVQYPLASDPGGPGSGGTIFYTAANSTTANVYEGRTYNVSDANTATWGATVTAGGGSNHAKVRYTQTKWTVMGA